MLISPVQLTTLNRTHGRAIMVLTDGTIYISRHYAIHRSRDNGQSWQLVCTMPRSLTRRVAEFSRLASRLLRHEAKAILRLSNDAHVAANREWVYVADPNERTMRRSVIQHGSQPLAPPMCMTLGPHDRVLFGEYNSRTGHGNPVRLFASDDRGQSFQIARTFEARSILHIHNLLHDPQNHCYWLLSGDFADEPGIGRLSEDLKEFTWVAKGEQRFRAVCAFDFGDKLVYATDSQLEQNALMIMDKKTGRFERGQPFEGSCIYAARFGKWYALTTSVEPSSANPSRDATLWLSQDGINWHEALRAPKDHWHPVYFQFGSIVLPRGESDDDVIVYSGQALTGIDNSVVISHASAQSCDSKKAVMAVHK